jgi:MHS family proline/betaine transporter-like MFS transporter
MLMTISTICMGLLPTYVSVGVGAPIGMILLRMIQGFCVGGESTGAPLYVIEMYPYKYRGLLGSLMWSAIGFGMLLGSVLVTTMLSRLTSEQLQHGFWRLPFLLSALTGIVGFYFRKKIPETMLYQANKQNVNQYKTPLWRVLREHQRIIVQIILLYGLSAMITYLIFVFMPAYMHQTIGIDIRQASMITTMALMGVTVLVPVSGFLSDLFGRKVCLSIGALGFLCLSIPLYLYMTVDKTLQSVIIAETIFTICAVFYQGGLASATQETTSTTHRYTVTAVGYNISYGVLGGCAPLLVTWASNVSNVSIVPGIYLTIFACLALLTIYRMKETYRIPLN